jgi:hypothetical protein
VDLAAVWSGTRVLRAQVHSFVLSRQNSPLVAVGTAHNLLVGNKEAMGVRAARKSAVAEACYLIPISFHAAVRDEEVVGQPLFPASLDARCKVFATLGKGGSRPMPDYLTGCLTGCQQVRWGCPARQVSDGTPNEPGDGPQEAAPKRPSKRDDYQ